LIAERVDDLVLVDEGDLEQAVLMLLEIEKTVVEGAGAAGLAALLKQPARFPAATWAWCCAAATSTRCCWRIIERGMVRAGRLARIRVGARDHPGVLARITAVVAEAGANIDEVHHQRAFSLAVGAERRGRTGAADAQHRPCGSGGGRAARGGLCGRGLLMPRQAAVIGPVLHSAAMRLPKFYFATFWFSPPSVAGEA
jgi:hypothetical protein